MFAIDSMTGRAGRGAGGRKRAWLLTSSLVLHGTALVMLTGFQAWQVPAVAEPPIADVFEVQLPLPPLPAAPAHHESKADSPKPRAEAPKTPVPPAAPAPAAPTQPDSRAMPEKVPVPAAVPLPADPQPGPRDSGDPNLRIKGNGDGNGDGPIGRGDDRGDDDRALPIGGPISRPQIIPGTKVQPRYTEVARQARLQGAVILQATIDERGNVIDVHVEKALRFGLDEEAVKAVSQWKFTPALLHGRPVKVYFDLTVQFEIR